jgi:hypothetical protein
MYERSGLKQLHELQIRQVVEGLSYIHMLEMVHGDLKGVCASSVSAAYKKLMPVPGQRARRQSLEGSDRRLRAYSLPHVHRDQCNDVAVRDRCVHGAGAVR